MSDTVSRRVLLSTALGVAVASIDITSASAEDRVDASGDRVDVLVSIKWNDGSAVKGAKVFDHIPNRLLGETNDGGTFFFTANYGTVVRLVEPQYGVQQSLFKVDGTPRVSGTKVPGNNKMVSGFAEGWTLRG